MCDSALILDGENVLLKDVTLEDEDPIEKGDNTVVLGMRGGVADYVAKVTSAMSKLSNGNKKSTATIGEAKKAKMTAPTAKA